MMDAFVEMLADEGTAPHTSIDVSVDSHIMAMAAEHSRLCGGQNVLFGTLPPKTPRGAVYERTKRPAVGGPARHPPARL